jgi:hypothetical protein
VDALAKPAPYDAPPAGAGHASADYFFRNLHQQLVQLSAQADLKGSIMITTSALLLGLVVPRVATAGEVHWGAVLFVLLDVGALLAAVLAVFPGGSKVVGRPDPLYFAHAAAMSRDEYLDQMLTIAQDRDSIYRAVASNLHSFSFYLTHGKFRYLRWSYGLLLVGVVLGLLVEAVTTVVA